MNIESFGFSFKNSPFQQKKILNKFSGSRTNHVNKTKAEKSKKTLREIEGIGKKEKKKHSKMIRSFEKKPYR